MLSPPCERTRAVSGPFLRHQISDGSPRSMRGSSDRRWLLQSRCAERQLLARLAGSQSALLHTTGPDGDRGHGDHRNHGRQAMVTKTMVIGGCGETGWMEPQGFEVVLVRSRNQVPYPPPDAYVSGPPRIRVVIGKSLASLLAPEISVGICRRPG